LLDITKKPLYLIHNSQHCDTKPDNWVLTSSNQCTDNLENYVGPASDVMLVDFGRAVDLKQTLDDGLYGSIAAEDLECTAMRCGHNWSYDIDLHGVCVCAYILLHGKYLEMERDSTLKSPSWRLKKPFKRYWQQYLWKMLFDSFLNLRSPVDLKEYTCMLKALRGAFDQYLNQRKQKTELISLLTRQRRMLPSGMT
jgi:serine/threonine protein kinase